MLGTVYNKSRLRRNAQAVLHCIYQFPTHRAWVVARSRVWCVGILDQARVGTLPFNTIRAILRRLGRLHWICTQAPFSPYYGFQGQVAAL